MGAVIGHDDVREALEKSLPLVTLLRGPSSVGKMTLAKHLAAFYEVSATDLLVVERLSAEAARGVKQFAATSPLGGCFKMVVLRLDGASSQALNALLKVLEEPPTSVRFILVASEPTLDTIVSRAHAFNLGLLTREQVSSVLTACLGEEIQYARSAAAYSGGQVARARQFAHVETAKAAVVSLLKAFADHDPDLFDAVAKKWSPYDSETRKFSTEAHGLLQQWCLEALTGQWSVFSDAETFNLSRTPLPRQILVGLGKSGLARPELAVRSALSALVRPKE